MAVKRRERCECGDPGCQADHSLVNGCGRASAVVLYRIDMMDESGTAMCRACAADAMDSGVFTDNHDGEGDGW